MRQSKLFIKTQKNDPKDAQTAGGRFLIRAGFIDKLSAGVYTYLPFGLRVLKKIEKIIREEMDNIGGQEILMPSLTPKENWEKTGRWEAFDALFRLKGFDGREYALAATHEEVIVPLMQKFIFSYQDLPFYVYQIQNKFRNEIRAKSGILRAREFIMKDLYSFHADEKDLDEYYEKAKKAYFKIFKRIGLQKYTFLTLASGGSFSKYSHEFQVKTDAGEDIIHICRKCLLAINKEIKGEHKKCPGCGGDKFEDQKAIEGGNIFKLNTKYSAPFEMNYKDKNGNSKPVIMGCYGIGLGRLLGAVAETSNDERGLIWPKEIAPFQVHLIRIKNPSYAKASEDKKKPKVKSQVDKMADKIYKDLQKQGIEVLYDDRDGVSAGFKFAESDLFGIPLRVVVSERTLKEKGVEVKKRSKSKSRIVREKELVDILNP